MNNSFRNPILSCIVVLIVACFCICPVTVIGITFSSIDQTQYSTAEENRIQAVQGANESGGNQSLDDGQIPSDIAQQMDLIEEQVLLIRGLQPAEDVRRVLYTKEELHQRVLDDFFADYQPEEAAYDVIVLNAFGLLLPEFDLHSMYVDLFSEQVAGFYDDETNEMVVVQENGFQTLERLTYAHEYVHALQDHNYDFEEILGITDEACEADSERCAAIQALVEGDASFTEIEWFFEFTTIEDQAELFAAVDEINSPILDSAPLFLQEDFLFPYTYGLEFVQSLHDRGGWAAIDAAFLNPPVSTEQIIHPTRYPNDVPIEIEHPDILPILGEGWENIDTGVMGEWYIYLILAYGIDPDARQDEIIAMSAAKGWGGDMYTVYWNPALKQTAMLMDILWESDGETEEFAQVFLNYAVTRFGEAHTIQEDLHTWQTQDGFHMLQIQGNHSIWIFAPSQEIADSILDSLDIE